jgi:hypothetical protein
MRKTWLSRNAPATTFWSERAVRRSVPNGFSMMIRTSTLSWRCSPAALSWSTMTGKNSGAVDR